MPFLSFSFPSLPPSLLLVVIRDTYFVVVVVDVDAESDVVVVVVVVVVCS